MKLRDDDDIEHVTFCNAYKFIPLCMVAFSTMTADDEWAGLGRPWNLLDIHMTPFYFRWKNLYQKCSVKVYEMVEDRNIRVPALRPAQVAVREVKNFPAIPFWPGLSLDVAEARDRASGSGVAEGDGVEPNAEPDPPFPDPYNEIGGGPIGCPGPISDVIHRIVRGAAATFWDAIMSSDDDSSSDHGDGSDDGSKGSHRTKSSSSSSSSSSDSSSSSNKSKVTAKSTEAHPKGPKTFDGDKRAHDSWIVTGLGSLHYDSKKQTLSAHCSMDDHGGKCHCNKQLTVGTKALGGGRPLGFLFCWLSGPHDNPHAWHDHKSHRELAERHNRYHPDLQWEKRNQLRLWAMDQPELTSFVERNLEAPPLPGAGLEPKEL